MKNVFKYIGIVLSAILPVLGFLYLTAIYDIFIYNWLWCGFYGCIIVCLLCKSKIYKFTITILNLVIILLLAFGALMGGLHGLGLILMHLIIPFYSALF